jgi:hypothetical protein
VRPGIRAAAVGGAAALGALFLSALGEACGGTTNPVGAGQSCSLATDCIDGLVCVPQDNGLSVCSDDLTKVAGKGPPEGGTADANGDGSGEAGRREGGGDATVTETGTPADTGGGGPTDTGGQ